MRLVLITDDPEFAREAEAAGVDEIMLDLEVVGKAERQRHRGLFLSTHAPESITPLRTALQRASLTVRVNPLGANTVAEVESAIAGGADAVMLPYFSTTQEVQDFVAIVEKRCAVIALIETAAAVQATDQIAHLGTIDRAHLGLNDLAISLGNTSIFDAMVTGLVEDAASRLAARGVPFGVGGAGRITATGLPVPPDVFLGEQVRLGATSFWLGRSFRGHLQANRRRGELGEAVIALRRTIERWQAASADELDRNRRRFVQFASEAH